MDSISLYHGDCLDVLSGLDDDSVDLVLTDPPYGLSFMGRKWDYDVPAVEVWAACLRVLKPGGHLMAFASTRTQHLMACRIEDGGFEIRDMLAWLYGSGFPKSHNGAWGGTGLKPAIEPITLARKPLVGTVAANFEAHGTGGLNIAECRVAPTGESKSRENEAGAGKRDSSGNATSFQPTSGFRGGAPDGRWPANVIHDGSEEVLGHFPESAGQQGDVGPMALARRGDTNCYGTYGPRSLFAKRNDSGSAARFFYCAKANKAERNLGDIENGHPTVKPLALMEYLCKLGSVAGSVVLDPFMGSGTTGIACKRLGRGFIGVEREAEYFEIASKRIDGAVCQMELLGVVDG